MPSTHDATPSISLSAPSTTTVTSNEPSFTPIDNGMFSTVLAAPIDVLEPRPLLAAKERALACGRGWRHGRPKNFCDVCGNEHLTGFCLTKGIAKPRPKRTTCYKGCLDQNGRKAQHGLAGCPLLRTLAP